MDIGVGVAPKELHSFKESKTSYSRLLGNAFAITNRCKHVIPELANFVFLVLQAIRNGVIK